MRRRTVLTIGIAMAVVAPAIGVGGWMLSLPGTPAAPTPTAIAPSETAAALTALRPVKRRLRPLIAILGANGATETETTDYVMPYGILRRADVADVIALATQRGPVRLYPALTVEPDATIAAFDRHHPDGADYVVVPAMSRDDDPAVMRWLKAQHGKGARIIGVCAGAKVVAATGLLDGRRATTHWYYRPEMLKAHPTIRYVPDRRFVIDGTIATTTGISASMPMMLTLIEAIGGRARATMVARDLGVASWDARHASGAFILSRPFAARVMANRIAFWRHERLAVPIRPGMDEVSLALAADAWSRTYRSRAVTVAEDTMVTTRSGLRVRPDADAARVPVDATVAPLDGPPAELLDRTLAAIGARYGAATARNVAMQLEYPGAGHSGDVTKMAP